MSDQSFEDRLQERIGQQFDDEVTLDREEAERVAKVVSLARTWLAAVEDRSDGPPCSACGGRAKHQEGCAYEELQYALSDLDMVKAT